MLTRYFNARRLGTLLPPHVVEYLRRVDEDLTSTDATATGADATATSATTAASTAQSTADTANTTANSALNIAKTVGVGEAFIWTTSNAGAYPAGNPTKDLVVTFYRDGSSVATRTLRGTLTSGTGSITVADQANTGEATTISIVNNTSTNVRVFVTHTASKQIAAVSFTSLNTTVATSLQLY